MEFIISHLAKSFGSKEVLRDIDFSFEGGKIYGLLGRNGAGKNIPDDGAAGGDSEADEAEERRLLYVGITRAKEELILTSGGKPSPFLSGLPQDIIKEKTVQKQYKQLSMF